MITQKQREQFALFLQSLNDGEIQDVSKELLIQFPTIRIVHETTQINNDQIKTIQQFSISRRVSK